MYIANKHEICYNFRGTFLVKYIHQRTSSVKQRPNFTCDYLSPSIMSFHQLSVRKHYRYTKKVYENDISLTTLLHLSRIYPHARPHTHTHTHTSQSRVVVEAADSWLRIDCSNHKRRSCLG